MRASDIRLKAGQNKDKKRRLNEDGLSAMTWLVSRGDLAENLLLHLDERTRGLVLNPTVSGQRRVNELFRLVQERIVRRGGRADSREAGRWPKARAGRSEGLASRRTDRARAPTVASPNRRNVWSRHPAEGFMDFLSRRARSGRE